MKIGSPFPDVIARVERQTQQARDFVAPAKNLRVTLQDDRPTLVLDDRSGVRPFAITELVHDQIAGITGIPAPYYQRMRDQAPQLMAHNLNAWLGRSAERHLIRTLHDPAQPLARAVLSDRYRPLDHDALLAAVLPSLRDEGVTIASCEMTERRLYIKALNERVRGEVKVGEAVMAGIVISNSEVGLGALSIQPLVYTLRCTNGMIIEDSSLRRHHVGRRHDGGDEILHLLSTEARQADDKAFFLKVRDITRAALDEAVFRQQLGRLQEAARQAIDPAQAEQVVEVTAKRYHLSSQESGAILAHFRVGNDFSQWGLSSAVTRHAQDVEGYDRATELERIGGRVVEDVSGSGRPLIGLN